ncbi:MAG: Eco57I restriction-modification methylase domain-containing protein, partial [Gammaproteobacteria bacterium]|nr:Eco57I restriction-modification methylase domain-containing protein [Gammaproteobacteria bacterium]
MLTELRENIGIALRKLGDKRTPFRIAVLSLLTTLGYMSDRTSELGGVKGFKSEAGTLRDRDLKLVDDWNDCQIVFQITSSEIQGKHETEIVSNYIHSFLFIAVELNPSKSYSRGYITKATRLINSVWKVPVIVVFRHDKYITVSVIHRRANKKDSDKDVLEHVTLIKDINTENPHRGHIDILCELSLTHMQDLKVEDFDQLHEQWEKVLSAHELNRRFYRELLAWYQHASKICKFPSEGDGSIQTQQNVIRLITRLLFIWFLKEMKLVPVELFSEEFAQSVLKDYSPGSTDYYRAVMQNLFFSTLNTEMDNRYFEAESDSVGTYKYLNLLSDHRQLCSIFSSIPFVNGGLFDALDSDGFYSETSGVEGLHVPSHLFFKEKNGLFSIFNRYKFTIEESTPIEREVALDPELLGCVFENLLDVYNPDSGNTERHDTGSYYTPRQVVDYMVRSAIVERLVNELGSADEDWWRERLNYLFDHEYSRDDYSQYFEEAEIKSIIASVAELKILDPAVGSGAFIISSLQILTLALNRLDSKNTIWKEVQVHKALRQASFEFSEQNDSRRREDVLKDINESFEKFRKPDYGRKLYLFHNSMYGVDVQPIACQIAKLRFFISLVVEQRADERKDNFGITPLPNLETNLVAADSLHKVNHRLEEKLQLDEWAVIQRDVQNIRQKYFLASSQATKRNIVEQDARIRQNLAIELERRQAEWIESEARRIATNAENIPDQKHREKYRLDQLRHLEKSKAKWEQILGTAYKIAKWNPYNQSSRADWFDASYMFGLTRGFDIVIGNPPYIQLQHDRGRLAKKYQSERYETFSASGDIYVLFFERGMECLTRDTGVLTFITSNSWQQAKYGGKLRKYFFERHSPLQLIEMGTDCFESATVDTTILIVREGKSSEEGHCVGFEIGVKKGSFESLPINKKGVVRTKNSRFWRALSKVEQSILDKMESIGTPLYDWDVSINFGVKTGLSEAFIVDTDTRDRLVREDSKSMEVLKPILRGRDIGRYRANWAGLWLIATFAPLNLDIDNYPSIKNHLLSYGRNRLRQDGLIFADGSKSRKKTRNAWFELQDTCAY